METFSPKKKMFAKQATQRMQPSLKLLWDDWYYVTQRSNFSPMRYSYLDPELKFKDIFWICILISSMEMQEFQYDV